MSTAVLTSLNTVAIKTTDASLDLPIAKYVIMTLEVQRAFFSQIKPLRNKECQNDFTLNSRHIWALNVPAGTYSVCIAPTQQFFENSQ